MSGHSPLYCRLAFIRLGYSGRFAIFIPNRESSLIRLKAMEQSTELLATILFLGIGLSHLLQPLAWVEFFTWLRQRGRAGVFVEGFMCLGFGALIVAFHNVWSGMST